LTSQQATNVFEQYVLGSLLAVAPIPPTDHDWLLALASVKLVWNTP
jgi:hypothetical protein